MIPLNFTLQVAGPAPHDFEDDPQEIDLQECQKNNDDIRLTVYATDQNGVAINLATASALTIKLLRPDGTTASKDASLLTNGIDGAMQYSTNKTDLAESGQYRIQGEYVIGGKTQTTRLGKFRVVSNIES